MRRYLADVTRAPISRIAAIAAAPLAAALLAVGPARAQDYEEYRVVSPIDVVAPVARVLGGAHHLRRLCDRDDYTWREQMEALIALEAEGDDRRSRRLIDAFNDGYREQERLYSRCNAEARRAEIELAADGKRLAEAIQDRYLH
ncbi:MAG: TIGR02301 family protein [Maricaulaceae bacterium]|jgi:uncharacterized protein (TIGR02301 family)